MQEDESLRGAYTAMATNVYEDSRDASMLKKMADKMTKGTNHKRLNRSIIIDASMDCMAEVLYVRNELIQGSVDGVEEC
jgi:hypothetical protein